ncbi:bifunctional 4-hydroxy-2-oxoglutarate aldolase/2-dehydro-3-deoxy-phosphogluconate aldolase [Lusitaniella coriacea LEGE 07157]|uniref:Bifunctional 4-hydroxy-2-oxoglutarate aldolase/2-dehydro-3-deoxy-phosphogluconate aldolase n=1 Tax=Lusitaniella coriacea LEGE 07157 TaxID=945747 RepID=A0A8J7AMM1_9CYAN|nr:bifunctional 4-hydroxy-2-oxoglutarate aldolase/2-dehydro-3-deoxy-phosphogluconate aldolase [Lusitaniella coriacea]MBE9114648.1 bifunctional 4-hydroxy-2-oxoglutarate aldolase/2-dehydro-3-deoxy-phosphogluconate aldolase [Lusitaniella coriacea LEGE 07157]
MSSWLDHLQHYRAIAVIRSANIEQGVQMAQAVATGGMKFIEITWNSEQPEVLIERLRQSLPHCYIGTGTILNPEQMQRAIAAGAQFIFSPHVDSALITIANEAGIPMIPGALTPTEMVRAWQAGATCVKVFPIQAVGGASYIKALQGPLGQIPLIPTGGVTLENAKDFIEAGAIAVGLSSQLFPPDLLRVGDWRAIAQRAQHFQTQLNDS